MQLWILDRKPEEFSNMESFILSLESVVGARFVLELGGMLVLRYWVYIRWSSAELLPYRGLSAQLRIDISNVLSVIDMWTCKSESDRFRVDGVPDMRKDQSAGVHTVNKAVVRI